MLRNVSSRIATRYGVNALLPTIDAVQQRFLNVDLPSPKRPFTPQLPPSPRSKSESRASNSTPSKNSRKDADKRRRVGEASDAKPLLRPSVLSERIKKLAEQGKLDDAITMLKNAPLDAQNTIVWNTIIFQCMQARHYKLAWQLYNDMKRRGFSPTIRSFLTLMTGYGKVQDWHLRGKQFENVQSVFHNFQQWLGNTDVTQMDELTTKSVRSVYSSYIAILGDAEEYQKMFDIYYSLPQEGPLAPDIYTFSALLHAISERREPGSTSRSIAIQHQNASDAKLIWRQLVKASEKSNFEINQHAVTAVLRSIAHGRPSDTLFGFEIVRDYCGLAKPGETPPTNHPELSSHAMTALFEFCNRQHKYGLTIHYFQQILDLPLQKQGELIPLTGNSMERVLRAYSHLASLGSMSEADQALETLQWMLRQCVLHPQLKSQLQPNLTHYALVLTACWRGADWASAVRTFELLTGCHGEDFRDNVKGKPRIDSRSEKALKPDIKIFSNMLRTAFSSKDRENMRQCLRMAEFYEVESVLNAVIVGVPKNSAEAKKLALSEEQGDLVNLWKYRLERRDLLYYGVTMAEAMMDVCNKVVPRPDSRAIAAAAGEEEDAPDSYVLSDDERKRWRSLRSKAKEVIAIARTTKESVQNPSYENDPLGSRRGLERVDKQVEYDMARRTV
ncbi:hypothetical protein EIP86_001814 [Pleurotus ostreatoroseus]|nr:hypothetical protein EIP86_001814 [Pleurotus ostreatoroseus]